MAAATAHSSSSSSCSAAKSGFHSNGGPRPSEDGSGLMNPFLLKLEQKPKAVLSHDVGAGAPCLACDACADGLDLHFWRKICKNCSCRADEHDHDFIDQPDHAEFVIRKLFDTLPPNHFARYQRPSVDDSYANRLKAGGMAPIGGGLFRRGGGVGVTNFSGGTPTTLTTESISAPSPLSATEAAAAAEHFGGTTSGGSGEYNEIAERLRRMHAARRDREQQSQGQRSGNSNALEERSPHAALPPLPAGLPPSLPASDTQSVLSLPHHRSTASLAASSDIAEGGKPKLNAVITYKKTSPSGSSLLSTKSPTSSVQNLAKSEQVMPNGRGKNATEENSAAEDSSLNYAALREKFAAMSTAVNTKADVPPPRPSAPLRTLRITTTSPPIARRAPPMPTEPRRRRSPHGTALSDASGLTLSCDESTDGKADAYTWLPAGEPQLVGRYMRALPELERPLLGSHGAQLRRQRLAHQLPFHDCDADAAKSLRDAEERELHRRFVEHVKQNAVGIGEIVDSDEHQKRERDLSSRDPRKSGSFGTSSPLMSGGGGVRVKENGLKTAMHCRKCAEPFKWGDVGIVTPSHGTPNDIWHPACFRCDYCDQLLADLLYFYDKDGGASGKRPVASGTAKDVDGTPAKVMTPAATGPQFLCGRHYGERVYPRCNGCDELIFAKEYTFAEDASWHIDHFCCFGCDRHLGGHRYVTKQDRPYCIDCYMLKFARTCLVCRGKIAPFESRISLHDTLHWHADARCFRCTVCAKPLANEKFSLKDENVFCGAQCSRQFRERAATNPDLLKQHNK